MRSLIPAVAIVLLAASAASADPAMTRAPTLMRAGPSVRAHVVQDVPAHAQIDVGECHRDWCSASWRDIAGFVAISDITENDAPLLHREPPPPVVVGPFLGFGWGYGWHRHEY